MKIYVASKIYHANEWRHWRDVKGFNIISTWIDKPIQNDPAELRTLWNDSINELHNCDILIAVRLRDEKLKGTMVEIGGALTLRKPIVLVGEFEGTWIHNHIVFPVNTVYEAFNKVGTLSEIFR
jgi:nucleoside 2-deoxyribosyltransferase